MMLSLFNPWVIFTIVLALFASFGIGQYTGEQAEYERQQIEIAALNAKARETEQAMAQVAQTYGQTLRKANDVARTKETKLRADVASSALRLSIPTQSAVCATTVTTPTAGDNSGETRAELDRSTAEALIAITADGDQAIRKLNACIDTYEKMRSLK